MPIVEGPGGEQVEFPDDIAPEVMRDAMRRKFNWQTSVSPAAVIRPPVHDPNASPVEDWQTAATDPRVADAPVADFADQVGQGFFANYGDEIAAALGSLPNLVTGGRYGKDRQTILREFRERERKFEQEYPQAATVGELGGALGSAAVTGTGAGLLGAAPGVLRSAGVGALMSGAQGGLEATGRLEGDHSFGDYAGTFGEGAALPAIAGGVLGGVAGGVGRLLTPRVAPEAQKLLDEGVDLTPGEIVGGYAKRLEDVGTSVPFAGNLVRNRQAEGVESLNRATYRRVLDPLGKTYQGMFRKIDPEVGHASMGELKGMLGRRYEAIVPKLTARADDRLIAETQDIGARLPTSRLGDYKDAVRRYVDTVMDKNTGNLTGSGLRDTLRGLRDEGNRLIRSQSDPYDYALGQALHELRSRIEDSAGRYSPKAAMTKFRNLNNAYARYAIARDASSRVSSDMGEFTPASLHGAVRAADKTAGKGASASGKALMQDLSAPAKSVMTRRVADSGTPERGAIIGAFLAPQTTMATGALMTPLAGLYTKRGNAMFRDLARRSPHVKAAIRRAAARTGVTLGAEGEAMFGE